MPTVSSGGTVTAADWRKMQLQGCVFLPAAGRIFSGNVTDYGTIMYWTSNETSNNRAMYIRGLFARELNANLYSIPTATNKISVRLVKSL